MKYISSVSLFHIFPDFAWIFNMVRASDVSPDSVCFEDNFSVGSSDFPIDGILDSGWYDTPPDTPRSVSPDILTV